MPLSQRAETWDTLRSALSQKNSQDQQEEDSTSTQPNIEMFTFTLPSVHLVCPQPLAGGLGVGGLDPKSERDRGEKGQTTPSLPSLQVL